MAAALWGVYVSSHGLSSFGESYKEDWWAGYVSGLFWTACDVFCGLSMRRRRVLRARPCHVSGVCLDADGMARHRGHVQDGMCSTWEYEFWDGRGAPQPALHGG